jgi:hypothetical protein
MYDWVLRGSLSRLFLTLDRWAWCHQLEDNRPLGPLTSSILFDLHEVWARSE